MPSLQQPAQKGARHVSLYSPEPDGRHWTYTCPACGAVGRGEGRYRTMRNLYAHWRFANHPRQDTPPTADKPYRRRQG